MNSGKSQITRIVFGAVMAAIICVITLFRIPLGQSKVHFANAMCLLAGLLLGPVTGGLSAGLGSALYDVLFGGYDFLNAAITFVSKFAMAWVTGELFLLWQKKQLKPMVFIVTSIVINTLYYLFYGILAGQQAISIILYCLGIAIVTGFVVWLLHKLFPEAAALFPICLIGAMTYVTLYMLKTWIFKMWVEPIPVDTIPGVMVAKLIPSIINAAFAFVVAPVFYKAVFPALKATGIAKQLAAAEK